MEPAALLSDGTLRQFGTCSLGRRTFQHLVNDTAMIPRPLFASAFHTWTAEAKPLFWRSSFLRALNKLPVDFNSLGRECDRPIL